MRVSLTWIYENHKYTHEFLLLTEDIEDRIVNTTNLVTKEWFEDLKRDGFLLLLSPYDPDDENNFGLSFIHASLVSKIEPIQS